MTSLLSVTYTLFALVLLFVLSKSRKLRQDWTFALLLATLAIGLFAPFVDTYPVLFRILDSVIVLAGPLLLFYTRSVVGYPSERIQYMHLLVVCPTMGVALAVPQSTLALAIFKVSYLSSYLIYSLYTYLRESVSPRLSPRTIWFYVLFVGMALLCVSGILSVLQAMLMPISSWPVSEYVTIPVTAMLLLTLAFAGVRYHGPFSTYAEDGQYHLRTPPASGEEKAVLKTVFEAFEQLMDEQALFIEPDFSLGKAAAAIGVNTQLLSQAINENCKGGFSRWIAQARTKRFLELLASPENVQRSVLDLGLMAGFGSKSTFNRVVKDQTGRLPSEIKSEFLKKVPLRVS